MIKRFEEFILENKSYKTNPQFMDDHSKLDDTFVDFDLRNIPLEYLKKQFKNFKVYLTPLSHLNPLHELWKNGRIDEGIKCSLDVDKVKDAIMEKYPLMDWQFEEELRFNNIKVAIIIPNIDENIDMMVDDMSTMGYYVGFMNDMSYQGFPYVLLRFEPRFPNDITNQVRNMGVIYHLSPKYNFESIKKHGFIPQCKNSEFKYPPRVYFFKSKTSSDEIEKLGKKLYECDVNSKKNGEYILYSLSTDKIPSGVEFIGDCNYEQGICTESEIPYRCVIATQEIKIY